MSFSLISGRLPETTSSYLPEFRCLPRWIFTKCEPNRQQFDRSPGTFAFNSTSYIASSMPVFQHGGLSYNLTYYYNPACFLFQNALHNLEDMKQGRQSLVDRIHRDRTRQIPGHRRPFPFDKRVSFTVDCVTVVQLTVMWWLYCLFGYPRPPAPAVTPLINP